MVELTIKRDPIVTVGHDLNPGSSLPPATNALSAQHTPIFTSSSLWSHTRPETLVMACADGRLQESIDEFLAQRLGINYYDRIYAAGGPGALISGGFEILRADQFRRELTFLMQAHGTREVILLFHGAAEDGPEEAVCAHYRHVLPRATSAQIARQQEADAAEILRQIFRGLPQVRVQVYRAEVRRNNSVDFVTLIG